MSKQLKALIGEISQGTNRDSKKLFFINRFARGKCYALIDLTGEKHPFYIFATFFSTRYNVSIDIEKPSN
jgi:hypothetical protein